MSRFVIGDFLEVVGPSLQIDIAGRKVSGFTRLRMTDGATKLEFDTSPQASAITWKKNDATQITDGIALGEDKSANVDFHWPNPLTPRGTGVTFHLVVKRTKSDHELDFFKTATPPRGMADFEDEKGNRVAFFLARINHLLTLAEWRALDHTVSEVSAKAIQSSPLFDGDASSLIDSKPDHNKWTFGFGFAAGTDGVSRAIAIVDIDDESLAVNMRALRLEERAELRPRPLRWSRKLSLRCGGVRSDGAVTVWAVDWLGVPTFDNGSKESDAFTLRSFWQELARHWALGLRSIRSRNALTFFPTDINGGLDAWTFRYRCEKVKASLQTQLANVAPASPAVCTFELGAVLDTNGKAGSFKGTVTPSLEPLAQVTEKGLSRLVNVKLGASEQELGAFLIGGLMLDIKKLTSGTLEIAWAPVRAQLGQPPLAVDLSLEAAAGTPRPGTEDPERGFESENDLLQRERPLVIDLRPDPHEKTKLFVRENASGAHSRVLELLVRAQDKLMAGAADVVIIDPAPMLVARVSATGLEMPPDTILASYRDDGERPPGWELHTESGAMTLVLPPQAIGEEMIKGLLSVNGNKVPLEDRPFDFRLSPPARLSLDRTDIDTARAAAPWALRRLLDRREAVVGLKLDAARFELLYGLTTKIEKVAGLRIAEQDAFVGRIPLTPDLRDRAQPGLSNESLFQDDERRYANDALKWIRGLFTRPAQLPVFRDFAARERLVIHEGATFSFRPTRQTVHPIRIAEKPLGFVEKPDADFKRLRLRGGVDFPFESENIYVAVNDPKHAPTMPGVPQGHVAGLTFGALGGSGSQQAGFDEGRSIIISETTHGRLNSLTLIRIGRIGMLWHHARHVIVYERTTRTAPRYEKEQPNTFEGLAALRKVKEYVEITQPSRRYPDFPVAAEERPAAGPLTGCTFETQVIPVKPSWGHDIEEGWVIALRGPLENGEKPFYPEPKIFFEMARAAGKGSGAINHLASDPSQLYFFTTTREGLGADTDRWPAWPDVDFPLTRRPEAPKVNFLPGFSGSNHQPDAALHDYGQRRFTIDVFPPEEAANLLHGRPGNGLEARVRNVSLLRGGAANVRSSIDETVGAVFAASEAQIADGLNELAQHLERLASRGADATVAELAGLRTEARALLTSAAEKTNGLRTAVDAAKDAIDAGTNTWKTLQARNLANAKSGASLAQSKIGEKLKRDLKDVVAHFSDDSAEEARVAVRAANETVCRQAALRIEGAPFLLVEIRDRLRAELQRSIGELQAEVDRAKRAWGAKLVELVARFPAEDARALEAELFDVVLDVRARLVAFSGTFGRVIKGRLGPLFGDIAGDGGAVGRLTAAVGTLVDRITDSIDDALDVIPPFAVFPPDATAISGLLDAVFPELAPPFKAIADDLLSTLDKPFADWQKALGDQGTELEKFCDKTAKDLLKAIDDGAGVLDGLIDTVVDGWSAKVDDTLGKLETSATDVFKQFVIDHPNEAKLLEGAIDRAKFLQDEVAKAIAGLEAGLDDAAKTVRELADDAAAVARRAGAGLRRVGEQIEEAVANELRHVAKGAESAALELTRALAEGPITDTLRCTRDWVGYYYKTASDALDVTRAAGVFNDLGGGVLNGLSAQVPFDRIRDRILAQLGDFDVNKLFPDFAGLKLENLLSGMTIPTDPDGDYDWIKMRHGFDRARLTAWSEITIDKQFDDSPELFTLPPVTLSVVRPQFSAVSRIEADVNGVRAQRTRGQLVADWTVTLNGQMIMSIEKGGLYFDSEGGFRFDFGSNDLQLAPALQFVTDALRDLLPPSEGLTITPLLPGGVSVELSLPLPDIGTGAFTLTGITLFTHFDLLVAGGFEVRTGLWLSRPERPFGLAILFLGGGGWFGVDVRYKPTEEFETRVSVGLAAGAFIAVNFGVARGSAGILFTVGLDFYRNWLQSGSQDLAITIGILVWGEFSILGIASAYLRVILRVEYRNGEMTGYGNVSVSIKICWCFTLRVDAPIRLPFAGGGKKAASRALPAAAAAGTAAPASASSRMAQILDAHFANLDV